MQQQYQKYSAFYAWVCGLRRRHVKALARHPHHYATAAGLTALLYILGHHDSAAVSGVWGYAFLENVASAGEDL